MASWTGQYARSASIWLFLHPAPDLNLRASEVCRGSHLTKYSTILHDVAIGLVQIRRRPGHAGHSWSTRYAVESRPASHVGGLQREASRRRHRPGELRPG